MKEIAFERTKTPRPKPADETKLGFGNYYTDHMFMMNYDEGEGWHNPRIIPYGPISLEPSAMCLHYAQEVFEGLKAYRTESGRIQLFRPEKNMERLNLSNRRLCIPEIDEEFAVEAIKELVRTDADWVPSAEGASLYIRPFIFAVDPHVGVHPAKHLIFCIILSPGMGFTKTGGNYASSLKAQDEAAAAGYTQVLWLDGVERKYIEEVGTMNVFFVIGGEVVTPALQGSILGGITRLSCLEILRSLGMPVSERRISIEEVAEAADKGILQEAFGSGTAAVISPIGELKWGGRQMIINNGEIGPVSQKLYDTLTGIQWGKLPDTFGWTVRL